MAPHGPRLALAAAVFVAGLGLDQWTKHWAFTSLRGQPTKVLIAHRLELEYAFNPGSAFGMLASAPWARAMFIAITVSALVYMVVLIWRPPGLARSRAAALNATVAVALMASGALGNLIDRLVRVDAARMPFGDEIPFWILVQHPAAVAEAVAKRRNFMDVPRHGVVDFIVFRYGAGQQWPSFNVADTCLVVGVALFLAYLWAQGGIGPSERR